MFSLLVPLEKFRQPVFNNSSPDSQIVGGEMK
jgi:hypothetical protein